MTITFRYKTITRPDGSQIKTPSIPILLSGKESIDTIALLDSGADVSAMPLAIAEILGLDLSGDKSEAYGIGGAVDSIETTVDATLEKGHEKYKLRIAVKVILGNFDFPVLLGRADFFDGFIISFHQKNEKVSLKRVSGK